MEEERRCKNCGSIIPHDERQCPACGRLSIPPRTRSHGTGVPEPRRTTQPEHVESDSPSDTQTSEESKDEDVEYIESDIDAAPPKAKTDSYFTPVGCSGIDPPPPSESEGSQKEPPQEPSGGSKGCGCLIVTAAYGSEYAPQVVSIQQTRDHFKRQSDLFIRLWSVLERIYYSFSPKVSWSMNQSSGLKKMIRIILVAPGIKVLKFILPLFRRLLSLESS